MSNYPQAPPSYQAAPASPQKYTQYGSSQDSEPLLQETRGQSSRGVAAFGDDSDLPDDFKYVLNQCLDVSHRLLTCADRYGVTVSESALEIRQAFVRKVSGSCGGRAPNLIVLSLGLLYSLCPNCESLLKRKRIMSNSRAARHYHCCRTRLQ